MLALSAIGLLGLWFARDARGLIGERLAAKSIPMRSKLYKGVLLNTGDSLSKDQLKELVGMYFLNDVAGISEVKLRSPIDTVGPDTSFSS